MSLSFRVKRAAHVSGADMDRDMSARAMRVRGNVHIGGIGDVADVGVRLRHGMARRGDGSDKAARFRVFDARVSDAPSRVATDSRQNLPLVARVIARLMRSVQNAMSNDATFRKLLVFLRDGFAMKPRIAKRGTTIRGTQFIRREDKYLGNL